MLFSVAKKCFQTIFMAVLLTLSLITLPSDSLAAQGGVIFCERFTAENEPVGVATEFRTYEVSWIAFSAEPFNVPSLVFSIHKLSGNSTKNLIYQEECTVNAAWNNVFFEKMPFPGNGTYVLSFVKPDGSLIAEGKVVIKTQKNNEEAPALPEKIVLKGMTKAVASFVDPSFVRPVLPANVVPGSGLQTSVQASQTQLGNINTESNLNEKPVSK